MRPTPALLACGLLAACAASGPATSSTTSATTSSTTSSTGSTTVPVEGTAPPPVPDAVVARVRASTFPVRGLDCRTSQVGTAFVVDEDLLITAAHVAAGIRSPVLGPEDAALASRVVAFDPVADLAVLRVEDPLPPALPLGEAEPGSAVALVGYDGDGAEDTRQLVLRQAIRATGKDIYGVAGEGRDALQLDGVVVHGNSGGPIIDADGMVVGVVFANARGGTHTSFAVQVGEVQRLLGQVGTAPLETECR